MGTMAFIGALGKSRKPRGARLNAAVCAQLEDVEVSHASSHALDVGRLGSLALVAGDAQSSGMGAIHVTVAKRKDGTRVVGFTAERPEKGKVSPVQSELFMPMPTGLLDEQAATLSILTLNLLGSLEAAMPGSKNVVKGRKAIVLGGFDGGNSALATQLLTAWGAKVVAVTTSNAYKTASLGAVKTVDPRQKSWSETVPKFDYVIDTLGDESSSSVVEILRRQPFQAQYVTSASPLLLRICNEGLFRGASAIASVAKGNVPSDIARTIVPTEQGLEQVGEVLQMAARGELEHIPPSVVTTAELFEAVRWPKDAESGLRFGLPGLSLFEGVRVTEEAEPDPRLGSKDLFQELEQGLVVQSAAELKTVIGETKESVQTAVLFVGASWCRKCKELLPTYAELATSLAPSRPDVRFLMLDAEKLRSVARTLEITEVPEIVVFRDGKRVPAWLNTASPNLMELSIKNAL